MTLGGPVSAVLEADLQSFVRRNGIVVWLDADDRYSAFVDRLIEAREAGSLKYEVRAFRGSFLALMQELERLAGGPETRSIPWTTSCTGPTGRSWVLSEFGLTEAR